MTNLEALRARVGYPLTDNALEYALSKRSLDKDDIWQATSEAFDLAYADALVIVLTSPDSVSEGGYNISSNDKKFIAETANQIYKTYGQASFIPALTPTARFVQRW